MVHFLILQGHRRHEFQWLAKLQRNMQQAYLIAIGILNKVPSGIWSQQFPAGA